LNTGEAIVGNMGSDQRFDYTAMGDNINLGSRLEGLTKEYEVDIILSEATKKEVEKDFLTRELDFVAVKGKKKPIRIFELISNGDKEKVKSFEKGLKLYRKQEWDKAIAEFKKSDDPTSRIFIERCLVYKNNPPAKHWDYVWVMKTK